MNLISAILVHLWMVGWALARVREILGARIVKVDHQISSGEERT